MKIYDIFCDASIDTDYNLACGGCVIVDRDDNSMKTYAIIQPNATNNSGEILAIWLGIIKAYEIKNRIREDVRFRLFSDSRISIYGLRTWMLSWVLSQKPDGVLINTANKEVANQLYFRDIYNMISLYGLHIEFYHQRGHMTPVQMLKAEKSFERENNVAPWELGYSIQNLSYYNNYIDQFTRDTVKKYIATGELPTTGSVCIETIHPMFFYAHQSLISTYKKAINSGENYYNGGK